MLEWLNLKGHFHRTTTRAASTYSRLNFLAKYHKVTSLNVNATLKSHLHWRANATSGQYK